MVEGNVLGGCGCRQIVSYWQHKQREDSVSLYRIGGEELAIVETVATI
jgi:hypothetical protein